MNDKMIHCREFILESLAGCLVFCLLGLAMIILRVTSPCGDTCLDVEFAALSFFLIALLFLSHLITTLILRRFCKVEEEAEAPV